MNWSAAEWRTRMCLAQVEGGQPCWEQGKRAGGLPLTSRN